MLYASMIDPTYVERSCASDIQLELDKHLTVCLNALRRLHLLPHILYELIC